MDSSPATGSPAPDSEQPSCWNSSGCWLLAVTLLVTALAGGAMCSALMTDNWEDLRWNRARLEKIVTSILEESRESNTRRRGLVASKVEWLVDGQVARLVMIMPSSGTKRGRDDFGDEASFFLVPMHGGIWNLCMSLTEEQLTLLARLGFPQTYCVDYLAPAMTRGEEGRADWQHRMQNLSISCALVCLIVLGAAALVGAFGILKHQISAVLVTGVMYLLAATFALFTLAIMHFKRAQAKTRSDPIPARCDPVQLLLVDGICPSGEAVRNAATLDARYLAAREFTHGWSLDAGWAGVSFCLCAFLLWILLSKIMRYQPLHTALP